MSQAAPRVLIVEDQYFVAVDCELQLRSAGIECVGLATTAAEALDIAEREHPDFALMDIRLASVADGVEGGAPEAIPYLQSSAFSSATRSLSLRAAS